MKSELITSILEQQMGAGLLTGSQKSIIDRCTASVYQNYFHAKGALPMPLLSDWRTEVLQQPDPEAREIALAAELITEGSLNVFAHPTKLEEIFPKVQIAIFTNRAFACEIYIKAILYHCHVPIPKKDSNGKDFDRHSLASLFSLLSNEIKQTVYSYYHGLSESGFYDRMLLIANTFEEMRYAYEYRSLKTEIVFLESFTKYLKETAHNIIDTNQQTIPSSPAPAGQSL